MDRLYQRQRQPPAKNNRDAYCGSPNLDLETQSLLWKIPRSCVRPLRPHCRWRALVAALSGRWAWQRTLCQRVTRSRLAPAGAAARAGRWRCSRCWCTPTTAQSPTSGRRAAPPSTSCPACMPPSAADAPLWPLSGWLNPACIAVSVSGECACIYRTESLFRRWVEEYVLVSGLQWYWYLVPGLCKSARAASAPAPAVTSP